MAISVEFQESLKELVDKKTCSKTEMAKAMKVDYRSFSNALNYGILPKPMVLVKMANYFDVSLPYLLGSIEEDSFVKSSDPSNFHSRLEDLCTEKELSYYRVAKDCHFDKSFISKWRIKKHIPSLETLELLADYFEVSLDYLMGRTNKR